VRPGLTGLAQLYGHADLRREKKLHYDLTLHQEEKPGPGPQAHRHVYF
jgi:lipopolysaccharide/colanic/teichoic acid biosynthesis glycosyltransferase